MPRIDPVKLLSCLKVLLAPNGGIRSANEVKRLAELMLKYSKKLVSKCIYIQILKCTNTDLLEKFMGAGGWGLTHIWLSDGIRTMNWPLVQEILELLLLCPVDVQRLRSNTAPKLVKSLCKDGGNEGVRILATKLVEQWLKIVKGETMATAARNNSVNAVSGVANQNEVVENQEVTSTTTSASGKASMLNSGNTIIIESRPNAHASDNVKETDPLALTPSGGDDSIYRKVNSVNSNQAEASADSALVYKIMIKDGKQILAKVEQSSSSGSGGESVKEKSELDGRKDDLESDLTKDKEKNDDKEDKDVDKDKRDKEKNRDRDHKSSSSHRKSSSSSSSKSSSSKPSSSSSSSSSSKSKHSSSSHKSSSSSSSSSSKSKDRDKEKDKDRSFDKDKDKDKDRKSSSKSSSSSSSSSSKSKDRDRERDRDKDRQRSKDKDKEMDRSREEKDKIDVPSIDKLGKIPKKPRDENGNSSESSSSQKSQPTSITIPSKKASISIEVRKDIENRPKTVKTYNSQFRSHGLAEEAPPPPSRKGLKKPVSQSIPGTTIMSNIQLKRPSPPPSSTPAPAATSPASTSISDKDSHAPQEKKMKIDLTPSPTNPEKPGAIKLIAPKPKQTRMIWYLMKWLSHDDCGYG